MSTLGNGMKEVQSSRLAFHQMRPRSTRPTSLRRRWWFIQITQAVRKLIAHHARVTAGRLTFAPPLDWPGPSFGDHPGPLGAGPAASWTSPRAA
jgi:hypothetical protein